MKRFSWNDIKPVSLIVLFSIKQGQETIQAIFEAAQQAAEAQLFIHPLSIFPNN